MGVFGTGGSRAMSRRRPSAADARRTCFQSLIRALASSGAVFVV